MKFRSASNFSQCDVCQELKAQPHECIIDMFCSFDLSEVSIQFAIIGEVYLVFRQFFYLVIFFPHHVVAPVRCQQRFQDRDLTMDVRLGALKLYRQHLISQYSDRCAYWSLRDLSTDTMARTVVLSTDGADQVPKGFIKLKLCSHQ